MFRILSPSWPILRANKPFMPGVKLPVTPEPSSLPLCYNAPSVSLPLKRDETAREKIRQRVEAREREEKKIGVRMERALIAVN